MKLAYLRTDGIITRVVNFGEADKIITIFTRSHGKVQAFAKGARRPKSRIIAGSQFLSYCNFILYKGSEMYSVNSTDVIESFYGVRNDLVKLTYACHMSDMINDVVQENQPSPMVLRLFLNTLHILLNSEKQPELVNDIFEFRLLSLLGYAPDIYACIFCGSPFTGGGYFNFENDGIACIECSKSREPAKIMEEAGEPGETVFFLQPGTIKAMQHIVYSPMDRLFKFALSNGALSELSTFVDLYTGLKLEKKYKKLDYLKHL
jgi:DNA repair protein RecO (recombination protein O)